MVSKRYQRLEVTWFYESSCKIFVRQTLSRVNICDSYVYFLLDIYTVLSPEMKWIPFSNSTVSVPKIAQHCCPFSIMRLHEHARLGGFFFCNIKAKSRKLLSRIKKPRTAISLPNERQ